MTSLCIRQHTQDVRGYLCVSVCVRVCLSAHTGRPWLSISTHISTLVLGLSTLALPVDSHAERPTHRTSVGVRQHTQDVPVCPSAHTGRPCVSVSTHRTSVAVCVCPSAHTIRPWLSISTHISTLVLGLSTLAVPVDCGTHRTSVAVHQYTYQHAGPWTQHADPSRGLFGTSVCVRQHIQDVRGCPCVSVCVRVSPSAHTGRLWLSISSHISTLVLGLSTLTLPVDCSGDFGPRGLSVQCTHDVRGCPPAHTGRPWLSVITHRTFLAVRVCPCVSVSAHRTSVAVHRYTYQHAGPWTQHAGPSRGLFGTSEAVRVCPCVCISTHMTSLAVHQYTYQHTVHTGRSCVSVSTHRTSVAVRQHTQNVCGCPSVHILAHKGRPLLSVCVRVCPRVSVSTHMMSVAVHQYTYQHAGPWTQHAGPSRALFR
ncbi:hypothetical protein YC2023_066352 [Brassica napus]